MMGRCGNCHWWKGNGDRPSDPFEVTSDGKIFPCVNLEADGWDYWYANQKEPAHCKEFCKVGEYVPTGIWVDVAKVVEAVAEKVEEYHEPY